MKLNQTRYIIYMNGGENIPFDEDEMSKVMQAIIERKNVFLKSKEFNPSYHISIGKDEKFMNKFYADNHHYIEDGSITKYPVIEDIFGPWRHQLNALSESKNINNNIRIN